jgi:hypothetical protein
MGLLKYASSPRSPQPFHAAGSYWPEKHIASGNRSARLSAKWAASIPLFSKSAARPRSVGNASAGRPQWP